MEIFVLVTRHSSTPLAGLNDLKLPEHVLVETIVDIELHPVESRDTFGEMLRKVTKQPLGVRLFHFGDHFSHDGVRSAALLGIERRTYGLVPVGEALGKKPEVK